MIRDSNNVISTTMAVLLHVSLFGGLFVALDFGTSVHPSIPLAIKGTLVTDNAIVIPPPVEEVQPPPVETAPPDNSEQLRIEAEEKKRQEDARFEQQRLDRIKQQEAEKKRADDEKKRKEAEVEMERKRLEAERQRQADIERQRQENERQRQDELDSLRQSEIAAESSRSDAVNAGELARYMFALQQTVMRNWVEPATARAGIECVVSVRQLPGGQVAGVTIGSCNGDAAVKRSIEAAIYKASPLPTPADPSLFERNLRFTFKPEQ